MDDPEPESWAQQLRTQGISLEGCELIRRHLSEGQYPEAYLNYVLTMLQRPRKTPIRKPADYLFKYLTGKLLLVEFKRSLLPPAAAWGSPARVKIPRSASSVPTVPIEKVFDLAEVRQMYENPGPFAKRSDRASTFEAHLQLIYFNQGFVLESLG